MGATDRDPKQRPSEGMESLIFRTSVVIIYVDIEFAIHLILFFLKQKLHIFSLLVILFPVYKMMCTSIKCNNKNFYYKYVCIVLQIKNTFYQVFLKIYPKYICTIIINSVLTLKNLL